MIIVIKHGTNAGYEQCRRRDEGSCEDCRAARRAYVDAWKDRKDPGRRKNGPQRRYGPDPQARLWWRLTEQQRAFLQAVATDGVRAYGDRRFRQVIATSQVLDRYGLLGEYGTLTPAGHDLLAWALECAS